MEKDHTPEVRHCRRTAVAQGVSRTRPAPVVVYYLGDFPFGNSRCLTLNLYHHLVTMGLASTHVFLQKLPVGADVKPSVQSPREKPQLLDFRVWLFL